MGDQLITVHDVSQEYWYIGRTPCSCGGRFEMQGQAQQDRDGKSVDKLMTRCGTCGQSRQFVFDITAFHGAIVETMLLSDISMSISDKGLKTKVLRAAGSPVAAAVQAILMAAKAKDHLALDWIEDAIRHARTTLESD